jgi:lipopolysaccharide/colanic/teichoic acid biosynthesis glycosyltransferase
MPPENRNVSPSPAPALAVSAPRLLPESAPVVPPSGWYGPAKRAFDVVVALALLVLLAPALLVACSLVKLTSRGPVFYTQVRVGKGGRPFVIYKVRSMYHDCERRTGPQWSQKGDPRVMPVGRFLRRTHLDELPQLWNVLKGDMSLIGPRPERPEFVPQLEAALPRYRERLLVLPGVTGLAQVHLGPDTDLASVERKLAFDLYYVKTLGVWADARLLAATALHVVRPYAFQRLFFRLCPRRCAEAVTRPRGPPAH